MSPNEVGILGPARCFLAAYDQGPPTGCSNATRRTQNRTKSYEMPILNSHRPERGLRSTPGRPAGLSSLERSSVWITEYAPACWPLRRACGNEWGILTTSSDF